MALQGYNTSKISLLVRDIQSCLAPSFLFLSSLFSQMVAATVAGDLHHFAVPSYYHKVPPLDFYSTFITQHLHNLWKQFWKLKCPVCTVPIFLGCIIYYCNIRTFTSHQPAKLKVSYERPLRTLQNKVCINTSLLSTLGNQTGFKLFGLVFLHSVFRMFVQGCILPVNLLSVVFSNIQIYLGCYIHRMKSLLTLRLMAVLPQTEYILMPSSDSDTGTLLVRSSVCVMIPTDMNHWRFSCGGQSSITGKDCAHMQVWQSCLSGRQHVRSGSRPLPQLYSYTPKLSPRMCGNSHRDSDQQ